MVTGSPFCFGHISKRHEYVTAWSVVADHFPFGTSLQCASTRALKRSFILIAVGTALEAEGMFRPRLEGASGPEGGTSPTPEFLSSFPHYHYDDP